MSGRPRRPSGTPAAEQGLQSLMITVLPVALLLLACGGAEGGGSWAGRVDTLPNGTILVSNPATGIWDSASAWRIEEDLRIGNAEGEGPESFEQIAALAVDAAGRIYVLERGAGQIRVFDADGRHVRSVGRKGSGPAEMWDPSGMTWDGQGRLWVVDPGNRRYALFDTAGRFLTSHPRSMFFNAWPWPGGFDAAGRLIDHTALAGTAPPHDQVLVRYDSTLAPLDTLALPAYDAPRFELRRENSWTSSVVPYAPTLVWRLGARGYLWFGITAPYRIYQRSLDGDTVRIIEREYTPVSVAGEEKDSAIARMTWFIEQGGKADRSRIPDVKPAFRSFELDDEGNLWVEPPTARGDTTHPYDVFDPTGHYLGRVRSRVRIAAYPPPVFRRDALYTVVTDDDGIPYVVRARIVRGDGR